VVDAGGKVRSQPVRLGPFGEDTVPVLSGLRQDQWIVAAGGHLLREGQAVSPVDRANRPVAGTAKASAAAAARQVR